MGDVFSKSYSVPDAGQDDPFILSIALMLRDFITYISHIKIPKLGRGKDYGLFLELVDEKRIWVS